MENTQERHFNVSDENKHENTELFKQIPIEHTPFHAVKMDDVWFLTLGKYRLSEKLNSLEECQKEAFDASWMRIMQIMQIMIEEDKKNVQKVENTEKG